MNFGNSHYSLEPHHHPMSMIPLFPFYFYRGGEGIHSSYSVQVLKYSLLVFHRNFAGSRNDFEKLINGGQR